MEGRELVAMIKGTLGMGMEKQRLRQLTEGDHHVLSSPLLSFFSPSTWMGRRELSGEEGEKRARVRIGQSSQTVIPSVTQALSDSGDG
jgi:hypothetical protein